MGVFNLHPTIPTHASTVAQGLLILYMHLGKNYRKVRVIICNKKEKLKVD